MRALLIWTWMGIHCLVPQVMDRAPAGTWVQVPPHALGRHFTGVVHHAPPGPSHCHRLPSQAKTPGPHRCHVAVFSAPGSGSGGAVVAG